MILTIGLSLVNIHHLTQIQRRKGGGRGRGGENENLGIDPLNNFQIDHVPFKKYLKE